MNIFVGNLSFDAIEEDVKKLFGTFGDVGSALIVMEREKKAPKSRGFAFVEMPDDTQAANAIAALNGKEFMGRALIVNPSRPKTEAQRKNELKKRLDKIKARAASRQSKEPEEKIIRPSFKLNKPGTYKGGRRTRSFLKRKGLTGVAEEVKPRSKGWDNPGRWRKNKGE